MRVYIINAFTRDLFGGNPAAVVPLDEWPDEETMQKMAAQHNLSETAYIVPSGADYSIRWFTPGVEVDLCGHATLAAAHAYFNHMGYPGDRIRFHSRSGWLTVSRGEGGLLILDFPAHQAEAAANLPEIEQGLGLKPTETWRSPYDYVAVLESQEALETLAPDFTSISKLRSRGLIATAPGRDSDFVSRGFFPQSGIDEDPVTGSAHSVLTPYWASRLGRNRLSAIQVSGRRGYLDCEWKGDRVWIGGHARTYLVGEIQL